MSNEGTRPRVDEETPLLLVTGMAEYEGTSSSATFWKVGALFGAAAVGLGAFGAHGLKDHIQDQQRLANWATAAHYQLIHAVALLVARGNPVASTLFAVGMTLFSGGMYALVLDPATFKCMTPVIPLGGLCLVAGWLALLLGSSARYRRI